MLGDSAKDMKEPCPFCKIPALADKELGEAIVWREHNELQAVIISIMTGWRNGTGAGITYRIPWILPPFFSCPLSPLN